MDTNTKSHFLLLYSMILADGVIDAKELETLYRIGREHYGVTSEQINAAVVSSGVMNEIPSNDEDKIRILYEMALIAWADGVIQDSEKSMLKKYAQRYGVTEDKVDLLTDYLLGQAKENKNVEDVINSLKN